MISSKDEQAPRILVAMLDGVTWYRVQRADGTLGITRKAYGAVMGPPNVETVRGRIEPRDGVGFGTPLLLPPED
jgi:hypothetical protein